MTHAQSQRIRADPSDGPGAAPNRFAPWKRAREPALGRRKTPARPPFHSQASPVNKGFMSSGNCPRTSAI
jgi:hypothetical protein